MKLLAIARREVLACLRAPAAWAVAAAFLALSGYGLWLFASLLARRGAPPAALWRVFFGGSLLYWIQVMATAVLATMRAVAEERRSGTLETLMTAPVSSLEVVLGKYLGALACFALAWLPTLLYPIVLARLGVAVDAGQVAAGYLGTLLAGAGACAVGLLCSTVTQHQLAAAGLALIALAGLLLVGRAAEAVDPDGAAAALLASLDVLKQAARFGAGTVDGRAVALQIGVALASLAAAARLLERPRAARRARARHAVEVAAAALAAVAAVALTARHPWQRDLTRARASTLAPLTGKLLDRLDRPVQVTALLLPSGGPADPYDDVRELLERFAARSPRLQLDWVGEGEGDRARALAARYRLSADDVADGAVLFARGDAAKLVRRGDLARIEIDPETGPRVAALTAEAAFDGALAALADERPLAVCFTRGHGEPAIDSLAVDGMSGFARALALMNAAPRTLAQLDAVPADCDVAAVVGAERPFAPSEIAALDGYLARGGRLLVLAGADGGFAPTGLETLTARHGVALGDALLIDPARRRDLTFTVDGGYGDHPISAPLVGRRTVWSLARPLLPADGAAALVRAERLYGETDAASALAGRAEFDPSRDVAPAPMVLAAAVERDGARMVVFGSAALARNDHDLAWNRDLLLGAVAWLGARPPPPLAPASPERDRLRLDDDARALLLRTCALGLPLVVLLLGAAVWWRRRA